jgi:hypothetical protein
MIGLYLIFLICLLFYFRFVREGYVSVTRDLSMDISKATLEQDLETLESGSRLIYIIYKAKAGAEVQQKIEDEIKSLSRPSEYKLIRLFAVVDETTATALFYYFFNQPIRYDTITVLTNNIGTTQSGSVRLISFVNTDTDFYRSIQTIITNNNVV